MTAHSTPNAAWTQRPERGSLALTRLMARLSLLLGRAPSRVLLRGIVAYFVIFGGSARRSAREFLARALGRPPAPGDLYRLYFHFGTALHDRVYFLRERFELFDIDVHGVEHIEPAGMVLMGAHLGSFEALRSCGRALAKRQVVMAMYEENARKVSGVLAAVAPQAKLDIVALGHVQSMIEVRRHLDAGALVGVLADRTLGDEPVLRVDFLGAPASFPTGPMRMAAVLRRRVLFMAGLYLGGNRYEFHFEPLADFTDVDGLSHAERDARVAAAVRAYAQRLELFARRAPYDWFNFHDFWSARP